jgi:hypothetical protein
MRCLYRAARQGSMMNIKTKNILTALVLVSIAVTIYVLAVIKAISR